MDKLGLQSGVFDQFEMCRGPLGCGFMEWVLFWPAQEARIRLLCRKCLGHSPLEKGLGNLK